MESTDIAPGDGD